MQLEAGAIIAGRYRLDRLLGEGGMGVVWAATHTVTLRRFALKFLKTRAHGGADLRRRFEREARAASAVNHPSVVHVHDVFECDEDTPVMVMDLLEGETLGTLLRREHALPIEQAASVLLPVASGVGTAHAAGIIHRDLKPDNIFLERGDGGPPRVRILDFGIAKLTELDGAGGTGAITGTGALLGTPVYMSPEQAMGEKDIDHRADVWAIGVILYEVLSGGRPVEGDNLGQVLKRLLSDGITPLHIAAPDVPAEVADLVTRMLARERAERPSSLAEVTAVLAKYTSVETPRFGEPQSEASTSRLKDISTSRSKEIRSSPQFIVDADAKEDSETQLSGASNDTHNAASMSVPRRAPRPRHYVAIAGVVAAIGVFAVLRPESTDGPGAQGVASSQGAIANAPAHPAATDEGSEPRAPASPPAAAAEPAAIPVSPAPAASSFATAPLGARTASGKRVPRGAPAPSPAAPRPAEAPPPPAARKPAPGEPGLIEEPPF